MSYFTVRTTLRTFKIEAAGIGDAFDRVINLILVPERETLVEIVA
jgi:hypothetical protein